MTRAPWALLGALAGFLVVLTTWPGVVTYDAVVQLVQVRAGVVNDINPALLARGWAVLDRVWSGAPLPFLLSNLCFWGGVVALVGARHRTPRAGLLAFGVGVLPPVLAHLAQIGKDTLHSAALTLTAGLLVRAATSARPRTMVALAGAGALLAAATRHNGAIPLLPLAIWGALILRPQGESRRRWIAGGVVATVAISLLAMLGNRAATDRRLYIEQHLWLWDLAGIAVRSGELELPAHLALVPDPPGLDAVRAAYTPLTCINLTMFPAASPVLRSSDDAAQVAQVRRAWLRAIRRHPADYLAHRLEVWRHLLGLYPGPNRSFEPVKTETMLLPRPGSLGTALLEGLRTTQDGLLWRPWAWALLAILLLWRGARRGDHAVVALCASALIYLAGYTVLAPAADLRYALWSIVAVALAGAAAIPPPEAR